MSGCQHVACSPGCALCAQERSTAPAATTLCGAPHERRGVSAGITTHCSTRACLATAMRVCRAGRSTAVNSSSSRLRRRQVAAHLQALKAARAATWRSMRGRQRRAPPLHVTVDKKTWQAICQTRRVPTLILTRNKLLRASSPPAGSGGTIRLSPSDGPRARRCGGGVAERGRGWRTRGGHAAMADLFGGG